MAIGLVPFLEDFFSLKRIRNWDVRFTRHTRYHKIREKILFGKMNEFIS